MPPKFVRNPAGSDYSHARRDEKVIECIDWSRYDISLYLGDNLTFTCKIYVVKQMVNLYVINVNCIIFVAVLCSISLPQKLLYVNFFKSES